MTQPFPFAIPFGGESDKELITITKRQGQDFKNTLGKGRFSPQTATDLTCLLSIATFKDGSVDEGTISMIETFVAGSVARDGLARAEHLMIRTGVISPTSLPGANNNGYQYDKLIRRFKNGKQHEPVENDTN